MVYRDMIKRLRAASTPRLVVLVALSYLLLGAFGLLLAFGPGYASPIFPAAGLALACLLWFDKRVLPGVWLGSLLLNLSVSLLHDTVSAATVAVAVLIAVGATVQAWAGSWLVHRLQGTGWKEIRHERDALLFLLLGGGVACLLSASIGVSALYSAGIVKPAGLLHSWWNWYVGDTLGVLVFTPLLVGLLHSDTEQQGAQRRFTVMPLLLTLCLLWLAFYGTNRLMTNEYQTRLTADSKVLAKSISDRLITHREVVTSLRNFIEVTPKLDFRQFEQFTRATLQDNPDIFALSFNDLISNDQRPAYEQMVSRLSPLGPFRIMERNSAKQLVPAAERPEYVPVRYIVPLASSKPAVGFDINSEPIRRAAINQARLSKEMAVTSPIQLVQEQKKRVGVLELIPVEDTFLKTGDQLPRQIGFAVSVIKVDQMIDIATRGRQPAGLLFQLTDPHATRDKALLYRSASDSEAVARLEKKADWETELQIGGRNWKLSVAATDLYQQQNRPWLAWGVGAAAILLTGLVQLLIIGMTGRTTEIQRVNQAVSAQLDNLFSCANVPIIVWDTNFKITRFSSAFETITWRKAEDVLGTDIAGLFPVEQVDEIMEQIKSAQRGERWEAVEIPVSNVAGAIRIVMWNSATIFAEDGVTPVATIAQGYDITERKQAQLAMAQLNEELSESMGMLEQEIGERQKAEEALQSLNASLKKLVDDEVRKNREKDGMLLHHEKLASIGQLAAGVAHEINNPMGFITANLNTLKEYVTALKKYFELVDERLRGSEQPELQQARHELDLDYILDDLQPLLAESTEGAERVRRIVLDLKDFARPDEQETHETNLNQLVESTINIVRNELKYVARLDLQLGELSPFVCHPQQINQVISNLLINAAHAIEHQGVITVKTWQDDSSVMLSIADTGNGIPPELRKRVFDPFFTTKEVGKGTGLGLSISYDIIKKHGGEIALVSEVGVGTTFTVTLPREEPKRLAEV